MAAIKAAFLAVADPNDWTGDGAPEGWKVMDRAYTKAEARAIPNGPGSTANMAHPTRTGDLVAFAQPPYQFDAATPGTLVARSAFFGQHGYVPDVQDLDASVNMRATFLAGGPAIARKRVRGMRTIDVAPTIAYLLRVPLPQQAQGRVRLDLLRRASSAKPLTVLGINDFHGQLEPTTTPVDGVNTRVGGAANLATLLREDAAALPGPALLLAGGDNVGASPPNSSLLDDRPAIDVENAWGSGRDRVRQPRVRLRDRPAQGPPEAGGLLVPGHQHRRDRDGPAHPPGCGPRRSSRSTGPRSG